MKLLLDKHGHFINRARWKAHFFLNPEERHNAKVTYGFTTYRTAPFVKEIADFENELASLISTGIKFTNFRSPLQRELQKCVNKVKENPNLLVNADKTSSIYQVSKQTYNQLLVNNVTKDYKHAPVNLVSQINDEAKGIAQELGLADRIEKHGDVYNFKRSQV